MRKSLITSLLIIVVLFFSNFFIVDAATNEDLIAYSKKRFDINGKIVSLKVADKVKIERYLTQNPVSEDQANKIISKIDEGISLLRKENVLDPTKLSKNKKEELLLIAQEAASVVGLKLTASKEGVLSVYDSNGKKIDEVTTNDSLVQTGNDNSYIVYIIAGISLIIIVRFTVYNVKKGKN